MHCQGGTRGQTLFPEQCAPLFLPLLCFSDSVLKESCLTVFLVGRLVCVSTLDAATLHLVRAPFFVSFVPLGSHIETRREIDHAVAIPAQQICFAAYRRHGCRQLCRREDLTGVTG